MASCANSSSRVPSLERRSSAASARVLAAVFLAWMGGVGLLLTAGAPPLVDAAFAEKKGACPPAARMQVCVFTCYEDFDCPGPTKCCHTLCGGTTCLRPITPPRLMLRNETGECPNKITTAWVCGNRCSGDQDCQRGFKCCTTRCGGHACLKAVQPRPLGDVPPAAEDPRYPGAPVYLK